MDGKDGLNLLKGLPAKVFKPAVFVARPLIHSMRLEWVVLNHGCCIVMIKINGLPGSCHWLGICWKSPAPILAGSGAGTPKLKSKSGWQPMNLAAKRISAILSSVAPRAQTMVFDGTGGRYRLLAVACLIALSAGCAPPPVVVRPTPANVYARPPANVYVEPVYPRPAPGYVWMYHPRYGWGWHHPSYGWYRGWPP